jgi:DMSO/TMAO reductase YedYZ molybdopterin-dependent catalytic subunit
VTHQPPRQRRPRPAEGRTDVHRNHRPGHQSPSSRRAGGGYTNVLPLETARAHGSLAVGMTGQPLPREHGSPARLLISGRHGQDGNLKWLRRLTVTNAPQHSPREEFLAGAALPSGGASPDACRRAQHQHGREPVDAAGDDSSAAARGCSPAYRFATGAPMFSGETAGRVPATRTCARSRRPPPARLATTRREVTHAQDHQP